MRSNVLSHPVLAGTVALGLLSSSSRAPSAPPPPPLYVAYRSNSTVQAFASAEAAPSEFIASGLNDPSALAFDSAGNLYVANQTVNTIVKVTAAGTASVFASTDLDGPAGLAFDAAGNLYAANFRGNSIVRFAPDGTPSLFASTGLANPVGLAFDSVGNLYVANNGNNTIEMFSADGTATLYADAGLNKPTGLVCDVAGNLYAANFGDGTIEGFYRAGGSGQVAYGFNLPTALALDLDENLYVSNAGDGTIQQIFSSSLGFTGLDGGYPFSSTGGSSAYPIALAFSPFVPPSTFFQGQVALGEGLFYLSFPNGNFFGVYYVASDDLSYIYHEDLGFEYVFDAADGQDGVYFYDPTSTSFFYTSPTFPFPYLYDFSLDAVLYYFPNPANDGHYNTGGVRYFYNFATGAVITK